jgi:hypothetical protein
MDRPTGSRLERRIGSFRDKVIPRTTGKGMLARVFRGRSEMADLPTASGATRSGLMILAHGPSRAGPGPTATGGRRHRAVALPAPHGAGREGCL